MVSYYRVEMNDRTRRLVEGPAMVTLHAMRQGCISKLLRNLVERELKESIQRWKSHVAVRPAPLDRSDLDLIRESEACREMRMALAKEMAETWQQGAVERVLMRLDLTRSLDKMCQESAPDAALFMSKLAALELQEDGKVDAAGHLIFVMQRQALGQAFGKWKSLLTAESGMFFPMHVRLNKIQVENERMAMRREDEAWHSPWCPALNVRLPGLPDRGVEASTEGGSKVVDRSRFANFKRFIRGPTDASSWLIKGAHVRVLFGAYPVGQAQSTDQVRTARSSAVAQLLLQGIDTFVNLINSHEVKHLIPVVRGSYTTEADETLQGLRNGAGLKVEAARAAATFARKRLDRGRSIGYSRDQLLILERAFAAREKTFKEAYQALKQLPVLLRHERHPLPKDGVGRDRKLEQICKHLEHLLRNGKSLYIFSSDGRGRAATVATVLLGRLYGLHAEEALQRVQDYHDAQSRNSESPFGQGYSCPKLANQAAQARRVIRLSQSSFHPTARRIQPETRQGIVTPLLRSDTRQNAQTWDMRHKQRRRGAPAYLEATVHHDHLVERNKRHEERRAQHKLERDEADLMQREEQRQRDRDIDERCLRSVGLFIPPPLPLPQQQDYEQPAQPSSTSHDSTFDNEPNQPPEDATDDLLENNPNDQLGPLPSSKRGSKSKRATLTPKRLSRFSLFKRRATVPPKPAG